MNRYDFRPLVWLLDFAAKSFIVAVLFICIAAAFSILSGKV